MNRTLLAAVATALALAGCAGGPSVADSPAAAAPAAQAGATGGATAAPMTIEQAGARWLELVGPANTAIAALNRAYREGASVDTLRKLAADAVEGDSAILRGLAGDPAWPAEVRIEVQQVAYGLSQQLSCLRAMARAGSRADVVEAWTELGRVSSGPAQALRAKLGLGPVAVS